jgi:hypothetical protein
MRIRLLFILLFSILYSTTEPVKKILSSFDFRYDRIFSLKYPPKFL